MDLHRSIKFGFVDETYSSPTRRYVEWSEAFATNAHMLIAGKSGTGKTYTLRRIVSQLVKPLPTRKPVRVYVFDVHGDMHFENESRVLFSESTHFGINPFHLSPDPHFGGVRKCVGNFIEMLNDSSPRSQLGPRQTSALRNLLYELFEQRGFLLNDPSTWLAESSTESTIHAPGRIYLDIPYDDREHAKTAAKAAQVELGFDTVKRCWWCSKYEGELQRWPLHEAGKRLPTIADAARLIAYRLKTMVVGGGSLAIRNLEEHQRKVQAWQKKLQKMRVDGLGAQDVEDLKLEVEADAAKLIETFTNYVLSIESGKELDALSRYESSETLRALGDRLDTMAASGIFKPRKPPFDELSPVWVYDISPLRDSDQQFFVWSMLQQIFNDAIESGPVQGASELNIAIVLDEAHKFFTDKESNILDKLAKESRKFGVGLICASQAPSHFSEDFLGNVSTKVLLGLDPMYREQTIKKMRLDGKILDYLIAGKVAAVQVSDKRDMSHHFVKTRVGN